MRKSDVVIRCEHGREYPAVNVKVYTDLPCPMPEEFAPMTRAWVDAHEIDFQTCWEWAAQDGFERAEYAAAEFFGAQVEVYSSGRSAGWLIVSGLPEVESWDAIMLGRWGRFARMARALANDVPYQTLANLYLIYISNMFDPEQNAARCERNAREAFAAYAAGE